MRAHLLVLTTLMATASGMAACSDDDAKPTDPIPKAVDAGRDSTVSIPDAAVEDVATKDQTTPEASACPDTPFNCSGDGGADSGAPPNDLRCTGLYSCWSTKTIAADHPSYTPAFTLYSDGAEKSRWVYLPPGTQIAAGGDAGSPDEWRFPVGTKVYKEFRLASKRIETRRIAKVGPTEWQFTVWRFSDDETSATLLDTGATLPNPLFPGKVYEIPSIGACNACHGGHDDKLLSVDAWSLGAPGATGITLASLVQQGRLSGWTFPTTLPVPEDATGKLGKVLGWQYNNCGFCHKPGRNGGASGLYLHLPVAEAVPGGLPDGGGGLADGSAGLPSAETPIYQTAVNVPHVNTSMFDNTHKRITPGDATKSVLPLRDALRNPDGGIAIGQMPPTMARTVDDAGVQSTIDWINNLP